MKHFAFTLAEVLITLGIIGVVAAITIPGLMKHYQNKVLTEQFKQAIAAVEQGFKLAMAEDMTADLRGTELFERCKDSPDYPYNSDYWRDACAPALAKYFKGMKFESVPDQMAQGDNTNIMTDTAKCSELVGKTNKWWYLHDHSKCRGWKNIRVTLLNGVVMDFILNDYDWCSGQITALDINGAKGPNTWGRDTFTMMILNDGTITPQFSKRYAQILGKYNDANPANYLAGENWCKNNCYETTEEGARCGACVINSGWKYKY